HFGPGDRPVAALHAVTFPLSIDFSGVRTPGAGDACPESGESARKGPEIAKTGLRPLNLPFHCLHLICEKPLSDHIPP
ncbi:MAG: hypothetical protein OXE85_13840, partial [Roseovarius sp.]|nr:hypothetical protein [Roseovarius sp.]